MQLSPEIAFVAVLFAYAFAALVLDIGIYLRDGIRGLAKVFLIQLGFMILVGMWVGYFDVSLHGLSNTRLGKFAMIFLLGSIVSTFMAFSALWFSSSIKRHFPRFVAKLARDQALDI